MQVTICLLADGIGNVRSGGKAVDPKRYLGRASAYGANWRRSHRSNKQPPFRLFVFGVVDLAPGVRAKRANGRGRARGPPPTPPFLETKNQLRPFRKCHAFFHSGSSAVARALHVGSRPASLGVMLAGRCEHSTSCLFGSREQIFGVNEQVRGRRLVSRMNMCVADTRASGVCHAALPQQRGERRTTDEVDCDCKLVRSDRHRRTGRNHV